jgi:hypothetical protein
MQKSASKTCQAEKLLRTHFAKGRHLIKTPKIVKDMWGRCKLYLVTIHFLIPQPIFRPFALTHFCPKAR